MGVYIREPPLRGWSVLTGSTPSPKSGSPSPSPYYTPKVMAGQLYLPYHAHAMTIGDRSIHPVDNRILQAAIQPPFIYAMPESRRGLYIHECTADLAPHCTFFTCIGSSHKIIPMICYCMWTTALCPILTSLDIHTCCCLVERDCCFLYFFCMTLVVA